MQFNVIIRKINILIKIKNSKDFLKKHKKIECVFKFRNKLNIFKKLLMMFEKKLAE